MSEFTEQPNLIPRTEDGRQQVYFRRTDYCNEHRVLHMSSNGYAVVDNNIVMDQKTAEELVRYLQRYHETGRLFDEPEPERLPVLFRWMSADKSGIGFASYIPTSRFRWAMTCDLGDPVIPVQHFLREFVVIDEIDEFPDDLRALVEGGAE